MRRWPALRRSNPGLYVSLSAESTRVHMVDQIYFAVARAVDWEGLAADRVRTAYREAAFPVSRRRRANRRRGRPPS